MSKFIKWIRNRIYKIDFTQPFDKGLSMYDVLTMIRDSLNTFGNCAKGDDYNVART